MALVKKDVKYLNKDFAQFRQNLINFTRQYFPNTYNDFNETSPGMMFIEMASYVGDVLSYYTDQSFRESVLNNAQESANILNLAQLFGYQAKLNTPATVILDIFQLVPSKGTGNATEPDFDYALSISENVQVQTEAGINFVTVSPVDFNVDTAANSREVSVYSTDTSGNIEFYLLKKQVAAKSGELKTKTFEFDTPKPYDKITLPETNVLDIVDVISSTNDVWSQVNYLAQDTVFDSIANIPFNDVDMAEFRSTVPYILKLKRTPRRFVTRIRDDQKLDIQFGAGVSSDSDEELIPNPKNVGMGLQYLKRTTTTDVDPTNFLRTSTYGLAPNNETLTVRYTIGGSIEENIPGNSLNIITGINYNNINTADVNLDFVKSTVAANNPEPATGGKTKQDLESIRQEAMANFAAQNRMITREDYIARCYMLPAKFGSIAKAYVIGDSQQNTEDKSYPRETLSNPLALNLYTLAYNDQKQLVPLNTALKENLRTYLGQFRMLTDAINIKTSYIVNIGVDVDIIPTPNSNSQEVILRVVNRLKQLFNVERMQINGPINIPNIMSELDKVRGVQTVAGLDITNLYNTVTGYSKYVYDINGATKNGIIYPSLDPMIFEVRFPNKDIKGRIVS
tara:strand:- start:24815 stop:26686 length:1872 start_codon:yes stop_codon:yes gene_type:complete